MATRIQIRRDNAAVWTLVNPVLADGEIGIEKDTGKAKIGDGVTAWSALSYWDFGGMFSAEPSWETITTAITLVHKAQYFVDTSAGSFSVTLPASPTTGMYVAICDLAGCFNDYPLTIIRNESKIMNLSEDMVVAEKNVSFKLVYSGATYGWTVVI